MEHAQTDTGDAQELGRTCYLRLKQWEGTPYKESPGRPMKVAIGRSEAQSTVGTAERRKRSKAGWKQESERADSTDEVGERQSSRTQWREAARQMNELHLGTTKNASKF